VNSEAEGARAAAAAFRRASATRLRPGGWRDAGAMRAASQRRRALGRVLAQTSAALVRAVPAVPHSWGKITRPGSCALRGI